LKGKSSKGAPKGKPMKKTTGKSAVKKQMATPEYKPSIWLDGKQIPKELANAKPGATVTITAKAKLVSKSERLGSGDSVSVELDAMNVTAPKKPGKK
jgi:hypothetical protein